jgi:signal peptidase I
MAARNRMKYFWNGLFVMLLLGCVAYFRYGQPPFVAIPSKSMYPTLKVGDLAIVRPITAADVKVGEIVVVQLPKIIQVNYNYPSSVIHRIVSRKVVDGTLTFHSKGDNNPAQDPYAITSDYVRGAVVKVVPYAGYPILFFSSKQGRYFLIAAGAIYVLYLSMGFFDRKRPQVTRAKRRMTQLLNQDVLDRLKELEAYQLVQFEVLTQRIEDVQSLLSSDKVVEPGWRKVEWGVDGGNDLVQDVRNSEISSIDGVSFPPVSSLEETAAHAEVPRTQPIVQAEVRVKGKLEQKEAALHEPFYESVSPDLNLELPESQIATTESTPESAPNSVDGSPRLKAPVPRVLRKFHK